jgi:hypothetical protein
LQRIYDPSLSAGAKKRIFFVFGDCFLVFEMDKACLGDQERRLHVRPGRISMFEIERR